MSYSIYIEATVPANVFDKNMTYNYYPAIAAAGLDSLNSLHGMKAKKATSIVRQVILQLQAHPEYGDLIKGGGTWGTYDHLMEALQELYEALRKYPDGIISVL